MTRSPHPLRAASAALALALPLVVASPASAGPPPILELFAAVAEPFPGQGCGGDGCWTNYMRLTDLDGDGDLDAIFPNTSGFFSSPGAQPLEIWLNDGAGGFELSTAALLGAAVNATIRVVAVGDVDGDGDRDLVGPSASGQPDRLWIQQPEGTFVEEGATRLATSSRSGAVRFADVDSDGDLDLFIAQGYAAPDNPPAILLLNDGQGFFTDSAGALPQSGPGDDPDDVDFFDADGDFDVDVLLNFHTGSNALWLNEGGIFSDASEILPPPEDDRFHYGPTACDIDNDGDQDILIDNIGPSFTEQVLVNDGFGAFTAESDRLGGNTGNDDNGLVCLDFDQDGDQDVVIPSLSSPGERLFVNGGQGNFQLVEDAFSETFDPTLWMEIGDVDGDGRLDAVTAQGEGTPELEQVYLGTAAVAIDRSAPFIYSWNTQAFWPAVRFAVRDAATSDEGPRVVSVEAQVANAESPFPATWLGGDLYQVVLPEDTVELSLCATDPAGNTACLDVQHGGGTGGGGSGGEGPATTSTVGSTVNGSTSGPATTGSGATSGSDDGAGGYEDEDGGGGEGDGGCGCRTVGGDTRTTGAAAALVALAMAALSARRRRAPSARP